MKKLLTLLLCLTFLFVVVGCGSNTTSQQESEQTTATEEESDVPTLGEKMKDPEREAQINSQKNMTMGQTGNVQGLDITLVDAYLSEGDQYNMTELEPDHIFMVMDITLQNNSNEAVLPALISTTMFADGEACEQAFITTEQPALSTVSELSPGTHGTGSVVYQVPQSASNFELDIKADVFNTADVDVLVYKFDTNQVTH